MTKILRRKKAYFVITPSDLAALGHLPRKGGGKWRSNAGLQLREKTATQRVAVSCFYTSMMTGRIMGERLVFL